MIYCIVYTTQEKDEIAVITADRSHFTEADLARTDIQWFNTIADAIRVAGEIAERDNLRVKVL